jgi:hypothetical protein
MATEWPPDVQCVSDVDLMTTSLLAEKSLVNGQHRILNVMRINH